MQKHIRDQSEIQEVWWANDWVRGVVVYAMPLATIIAISQLGTAGIPTKWLLEVEVRDSPMLLGLELGEGTVVLRRQGQVARGTYSKIEVSGTTITFQNNLLVGPGQLILRVSKNNLSGKLRTKFFTENVNGIPVLQAAKRSALPPVDGPGFRQLEIPTLLVQAKTAGASIARLGDYAVAESGFFGVENAASGDPVTENTLFQAGGMGSVLTCLAALKLAGQGKLDLNAKVTSELPYVGPLQRDGKDVKVLDLLRGSSGLGQYKFRGYGQAVKAPSTEQLIRGADLDQVEPLKVIDVIGVQTAFNGINHVLLQAILERRCGKPFDALMQDLLFKPLGMTRSTFEMKPGHGHGITVATGHYESGEALINGNNIYPTLGDSGLYTTAPEMAKALAEAGRMLAGKPNMILPQTKLHLLSLVDGPKGVAGFVRGDDDTYFHGGDTYGQFCNFSLHPKTGMGVIVMTNRVMNWRLVGQILDLVGKG